MNQRKAIASLGSILTIALAFSVGAVLGPKVQPAHADGASTSVTTPSCTVTTSDGTSSGGGSSTSSSSTSSTTSSTTGTSHDNRDVVTIHDVDTHVIHDVKVGDINVLSNDLNNNSVLNNTDVDVSNVLNPVTSVLSNVHI